jgi:hypothetical protein
VPFLDDNRALGIKDSEYLENRNFLLTQISKSALTAYEKDLFEFFIDYNFFYANKWILNMMINIFFWLKI